MKMKNFKYEDNGSDLQFNALNKQAQEIALKEFHRADNLNHLVRLLDCDVEFREAIGCLDFDIYPKEIDGIARYYKAWRDYRETKFRGVPSCC